MLLFRGRRRFWLLAGIAVLLLAFCARVVIVTMRSEATAFSPRRGPIA
ncbi:MAG: hypothetical protein JWM74_850, partial [Myxococcaceae bacterium]|nr:hypothetical protein [Myxococcaceae bacterium]